MRLIGNKTKLLGDIHSVLRERGVTGGTFIDIFSGSASVARHFKSHGYRILANDFLSSCYTQAVAAVEVSSPPRFGKLIAAHRDLLLSADFQESIDGVDGGQGIRDFLHRRRRPRDGNGEVGVAGTPLRIVIQLLNRFVPPREGLIFRNFCPGGGRGRAYFRDEHGRKIDGILDFLTDHHRRGLLSSRELHLLLAALLDASDRRANISGTYGAFLKSWQSNTRGELLLEIPEITESPRRDHRAYQEDSNRLMRRIGGDILYIDPPYNQRQYAANYHVLEIIAEYHRLKDPEAFERTLYGKTGLRPYEDLYSDYCVPIGGRGGRQDVHGALRDLVLSANVEHVVMSYNEEGLLSREALGAILATFSGQRRFDFDRDFREVRYRRFRSDRDRAPGGKSGGGRVYRVVEGKERDEIGEWILYSRRSPRVRRRVVVPGRTPAAPARRPKSPMKKIKTVILEANPAVPECIQAARALEGELKKEGFRILDDSGNRDPKKADLVILLGGDGYLMESIHRLDYPSTNIFGVNFGNVGFLMNPRTCLEELTGIVTRQRFRTEEYPVLESRIRTRAGEELVELAFNDIVLERMSGQSIRFRATVDDVPFNDYSGDGIIIATSGGSTAYNLAAGGPVVHPEIAAMLITPLYPHRATPFHSLQFPLILPLNCVLNITGHDVAKRPIQLLADGRSSRDVEEVVVRDSGKRIRLLRLEEHRFIRTLASKFISETPPNREPPSRG